MWKYFVICMFCLMTYFPQGLCADVADRLDGVVGDLEALVADLELAQAQTADLRSRIASLEDLTTDHLATLQNQERLLTAYQASVETLEAHDKAALSLAQDLRAQLETERAVTGWLGWVAGTAAVVAVAEAVVLVVGR